MGKGWKMAWMAMLVMVEVLRFVSRTKADLVGSAC
jgi:hypothetical protein